MVDDPDSLPTDFQLEVAQLFFGLPGSDGFLLAGGAALLAQGLTARPTQDLDFFTRPHAGDVGLARDHFLVAAGGRGWDVDTVQDSATFCRLLVHGPEDLLIDLALDSAPGRPATASIAGPTFAPAELAGRKVVALFDRAAARDFVDVFALSRRFSKSALLDLAREVDAGFDVGVFVEMIGLLARYRDVDLALGDVDVAVLGSSSNGGGPSPGLSGPDAPTSSSDRPAIDPARWKAVRRRGIGKGVDHGMAAPADGMALTLSPGSRRDTAPGSAIGSRATVVQHHDRKQPSQPTSSAQERAVTSGAPRQPTQPTAAGKR